MPIRFAVAVPLCDQLGGPLCGVVRTAQRRPIDNSTTTNTNGGGLVLFGAPPAGR